MTEHERRKIHQDLDFILDADPSAANTFRYALMSAAKFLRNESAETAGDWTEVKPLPSELLVHHPAPHNDRLPVEKRR